MRWREIGATASNAAGFSSSLDGGELFSRIQDRGDQAFTERGMEPVGTWVFIFGPVHAVYRSVSGPAHSLSRSLELPAGFCSWGLRNVGASGPAFHPRLRAGLGDGFSAAPMPCASHSSRGRSFSHLQKHPPPSKKWRPGPVVLIDLMSLIPSAPAAGKSIHATQTSSLLPPRPSGDSFPS